jgi:hypothetical protein
MGIKIFRQGHLIPVTPRKYSRSMNAWFLNWSNQPVIINYVDLHLIVKKCEIARVTSSPLSPFLPFPIFKWTKVIQYV